MIGRSEGEGSCSYLLSMVTRSREDPSVRSCKKEVVPSEGVGETLHKAATNKVSARLREVPQKAITAAVLMRVGRGRTYWSCVRGKAVGEGPLCQELRP